MVKELACTVKLNFSKKKHIRPESKKRKMFQIKRTVQQFYIKDDVSRWTPRKGQYVITKDENRKKVKQQKQFIKMTVGELHQLFKEKKPKY